METYEELAYEKRIEGKDFYTEEEINLLLEDDEISITEEAFMRGYMEEPE